MGKYWAKHLSERLQNDPTWPFNATVEFFDAKSDVKTTIAYLEKRVNDKSLPSVTGIIGPEGDPLGAAVGSIAGRHNIPCLLAVTSPSPTQVGRPAEFNTSFLIEPAAMYQFRTLIDVYLTSGVKTIVAVANNQAGDAYNNNTCFGSASHAATRGIQVIGEISISDPNEIEGIVETLSGKLKPDAVIWCDWAACALPDSIQQYNPLPYFKKANYLPKALSMLDCIDQPGVVQFYEEGLFQYVSAGQFVNEKLVGPDYTEDNYPYSSVFRPAAAKGHLTVSYTS